MDNSIKIFEILSEPSSRLFSLFYLKSKGFNKEQLDSHPNCNSVIIPQAISPDGDSTFYFLMKPEIEEYIRTLNLVPIKQPERYIKIIKDDPNERIAPGLRIDPEKIKWPEMKKKPQKKLSAGEWKDGISLTGTKYKRKYNDSIYCHYCARKFDHTIRELSFTIDHWKPKNKGGLNTKDNYRMCCWGCNQARNSVDIQTDIEMKFYKYIKYLNHLKEQGVQRIHLDFLEHIL